MASTAEVGSGTALTAAGLAINSVEVATIASGPALVAERDPVVSRRSADERLVEPGVVCQRPDLVADCFHASADALSASRPVAASPRPLCRKTGVSGCNCKPVEMPFCTCRKVTGSFMKSVDWEVVYF